MTKYLTALKVGVCNTSTMRLLHQREVALLVLDDRMLRIALANKISGGNNKSFFLWDKEHHRTICLRLMKPHCYLFIILTMVVLCFEKISTRLFSKLSKTNLGRHLSEGALASKAES